ncbi:HAD family hydrolase [Calidifontibacter terrae]
MSVGAVIFDWGGTLTPWHGDIDYHREWLGYAHVWDPAGADALADRIVAASNAAWAHARTDHTSASVESIVRAAGLDPDDPRHLVALRQHVAFWEEHTHTDPLVRPLWERLRENGIRVGVLSNTIWSREHHRGIFARDGVLDLIDADVYSSETPWAKPHPQAFRAAATAVGVEPAQCVYVGDRLFEDIHGSQQVGMRAILVPHSDIPVDQRVEVAVEPDAVVQSLDQVVDHVRRWNHEA